MMWASAGVGAQWGVNYCMPNQEDGKVQPGERQLSRKFPHYEDDAPNSLSIQDGVK
jgi:hypothetical protein